MHYLYFSEVVRIKVISENVPYSDQIFPCHDGSWIAEKMMPFLKIFVNFWVCIPMQNNNFGGGRQLKCCFFVT
jgi:hypothetical protein